ncbi:MAG: flavodoxin domain-containing protein [Thermoplasmata archaeon]|nr:flavodoxin domain-containing protein [Thermoplasmata archaeon]
MSKAIIYATGITKNTKAVADYMAKQLGADVFNLKDLSKLDISGYDTIIFGTGIHAGKPYKPVVEFIENNKEALAGKKQYLFIECMYNKEKGDAQCAKVAEQLGISDAVYFNKKAEEMNEAGFPKAVDEFIARL